MLQIVIPATPEQELWDERTSEFVKIPAQKEVVLQLEHSLISLSKWEANWCKFFFSNKEKTYEETIDYIRCMTLTPNAKPEVYYRLSQQNINDINAYIEAPMTATTFRNSGPPKRNSEQISSELIYYWMIAQNIPFECQKWHLNRLITLIRVCAIKNSPSKKKSRGDILREYASLDAERKARLGTKG